MPSYLVTGVNRGIGWAFLRKLSDDPNNIVVGTVRDKESMEKKIADELGSRSNIHIMNVELGSLDSIKVTNTRAESPEELEDDLFKSFKVNVVGVIHLFNLFLPLVLKGDVKKVISISSGMADIDMINQYHVDVGAPYSISKGAVNVAVSKFNAQYAKDGVLFLSICPGIVDTGHNENLGEQEMEGVTRTLAKFNEYAPGAKLATPEDAVNDVLRVIYDSGLENGRGQEMVMRKDTTDLVL
ncbi:putative oxidoreductase [Colletotrichum spaethianum]|uniref:Oxidoreductase n=1 Tax=Colletotrichum spaethianum TaxID=700344 RepID=A0AA37P1P4_9PEZI|nr:putative oxidoreductase [Colletotrichum spaethianum]GKT45143.1 putative oxidoreductase [Colletotrichum spaethianum]